MDLGLKDRVVLVTGASGGIGQQLVRAFGAEHARVIAHYHRQRERAAEAVEPLGDRGLVIPADLTDEAAVDALFEQAEERWGPVEIVVANAGVWPPDSVPLHEMSKAQWDKTLAVDLTSVFLTMRRFFRGVIQFELSDPAAILIGSTAGVFGEAGHADYAAAKAGLSYGLLATLKNELARLAPQGRVNAICPGWVLTPMTEKFAAAEDAMRRAQQTVALRKFAVPHDIASMAVTLASKVAAGHVTGQRIVISGGMEGRVLYDPDEVMLNEDRP